MPKRAKPSTLAASQTCCRQSLRLPFGKTFELGEHALGQHRTEMIRKWIARANDLLGQEDLLKKDRAYLPRNATAV